MAWYYGKWHSDYQNMPALSSDCTHGQGERTFRIIYPQNNSHIRLSPQSGTGHPAFIAEASALPRTTLYWHLDRIFLGITREDHRFSIEAEDGWHVLTVEDAGGTRKILRFELLSSE